MKISTFYEHLVEAATQENRPLEEICSQIRTWGITAVELDYARLQNERDTVIRVLGEAELGISCMYGFFDFAHGSVQGGYEMVDLAEQLGIKKVMPIPGFLKKYEFLPGIYLNRVNRMVAALKEICTYAKKKGIMTVLEDFDGKSAPFATADQLQYFLNRIPDLYCAFDTGNFLFSEEDSYAVLPRFLARIGHVHCKDRSLVAGEVQAREGEKPLLTVKGRQLYSCAVGSGVIRMKEIVEAVRINGYDGYFAIEHFGSPDQLGDMKKSADFLRSL